MNLSGESSIKGPAPENTDMSVPPAAVQTPDSPLYHFEDYEPEQAWGSHHDIREHLRYGGTMDEY